MPTQDVYCCGPCGSVVATAEAPEGTPQRTLQIAAGKPVCKVCKETWRPGGKRLPFFDPTNPPIG